MRFFFLLLLWLQFATPLSLAAQNIDSLARKVDSSRKVLEQSQEDFQRWQDSIRQIQLKRDIERNGQNLDRFLSEMKERERKEKLQMYIRLAMGVVFLTVLIIGITRRRRKQQNKV